MFFTAHLAAGLIIGKLTDNYTASLIAAMAPDADHAISYIRSGVLFRPKEFLNTISTTEDPAGDQRNFLHNIGSFVAITTAAFVMEIQLGWTIGIAYLSHLILDILDKADFYPLYPSMRFKLRGPIKYFSHEETLATILLFLVYFWLLLPTTA